METIEQLYARLGIKAPVVLPTKCSCQTTLDALHRSDEDPTLCVTCANKIVEEMQKDIGETTLVLWSKSFRIIR